MQFAATGDKFSWMPRFHAQFSPDRLSSDNQFNIGNRWTVRGFDGENTLSANQGWYWRNDFSWNIPTPTSRYILALTSAGSLVPSAPGREKAFQAQSAASAEK
jgi:hemolysin activation/secretion protein